MITSWRCPQDFWSCTGTQSPGISAGGAASDQWSSSRLLAPARIQRRSPGGLNILPAIWLFNAQMTWLKSSLSSPSSGNSNKTANNTPSRLLVLMVVCVICPLSGPAAVTIEGQLMTYSPWFRELRAEKERWWVRDLISDRSKTWSVARGATCPPRPALYLPPPPIMMNRCTGPLGWVRNWEYRHDLFTNFHINFHL